MAKDLKKAAGREAAGQPIDDPHGLQIRWVQHADWIGFYFSRIPCPIKGEQGASDFIMEL